MTGFPHHKRLYEWRRWSPAALCAWLCLSCVLLWPVASTAGAEPQPPVGALINKPLARQAFVPGESLVFNMRWGNIRAGTATMSVSAGIDESGRPVHRLISTAKSGKMLSMFYPVRDLVVSYLDPETSLPRKIEINQRHGKRRRFRTVEFDQAGQTAVTHQPGREPVKVEIPPNVHDIISCFYYFRGLPDIEPGNPVSVVDVHEGKKNWRLLVKPQHRERITVPAGTFDTFQIKAEVRFKGVFYDRGDVRIWLTDDERRLPVKVQVKIAIGSVVIELTKLYLPPVIAPGGSDTSIEQLTP